MAPYITATVSTYLTGELCRMLSQGPIGYHSYVDSALFSEFYWFDTK